jgi:uncharacterized protein YcgI (DUF1989 family)
MSTTVVPAREGRALVLRSGQSAKILNTFGTQVVDLWAVGVADPEEVLSMEHTRAVLQKIGFTTGDVLYSSRRVPMLTITHDTSPGVHDSLLAACDSERYRMLGFEGRHENCADNFARALTQIGVTPPRVPSPFNVFMNIPVDADGGVSFQAPLTSAGDYLTVRAEKDVALVLSACPQDLLPVNGQDCIPRSFEVELLA